VRVNGRNRNQLRRNKTGFPGSALIWASSALLRLLTNQPLSEGRAYYSQIWPYTAKSIAYNATYHKTTLVG